MSRFDDGDLGVIACASCGTPTPVEEEGVDHICPACDPVPCICVTNIFDNDPETGGKKHCYDCGGNDWNAPCAYPSESRQGCLRDARTLKQERGELMSQIVAMRGAIVRLCGCYPPPHGASKWLYEIVAKADKIILSELVAERGAT